MNECKETVLKEICQMKENLYNYINKSNTIVKYEHTGDHQFDGILNRNNIIKGSVCITSGADLWNGHEAPNLIDYSSNSYYSTCDHGDSNKNWVQFEIRDQLIQLLSYEIQSPSSGSLYPKSWKIAGSNNGKDWDPLDEQKDCSLMNGPNKIAYFTLKPTLKYYRYIRFIQLDSSYFYRKYDIRLSKFEIYGNTRFFINNK